MELIVAKILHIIEVNKSGEVETFTYEEQELDEMLAHLRALEEKSLTFSHRWEVSPEDEVG